LTNEEGAKTMTPRILAIAGSLRSESFKKKLVPIAAKGAREATGSQGTHRSMRTLPERRC
jgi:hypothetical protein